MIDGERTLTLFEAEIGLLDALAEYEDTGDETALAVVDGWLTGTLEKRDGYAKAHFALKAQIAACDEYVNRVKERKNVIENALKRLHDRALYVMQTTNQKKLQGNVHTLTARENPGQTIITDESLIPEQYMREKVVRTPDKTAIRKAIESGESVPGADLEMGGYSLLVK